MLAVETEILSYGEHTQRERIKRYLIPGERPIYRGVIAIHGGAWRDPNNTCSDFDEYVQKWAEMNDIEEGRKRGLGMVVYSVDYKLSSERGVFPQIVFDIMGALEVIKGDSRQFWAEEEDGGNVSSYNDNNNNNDNNNDNECHGDPQSKELDFTIVGHSVGCTIITQILEIDSVRCGNDIGLLPLISRAVFLDGIYNVASMLSEYPEYEFFILEEFGSIENSKRCNSITQGCVCISPLVLQKWQQLQDILIIHSSRDELLSFKQADEFRDWLKANGLYQFQCIYKDFGMHNNVYVNPEVAAVVYRYI